jgi:hypothetical protein
VDIWHWRARYTDGSVIDEYDRPEGRGFAEVEQHRLAAVELVPQRPGLAAPCVEIDVSRGLRPVFFRRRTIELSLSGGEAAHATVTALGWARGDERALLFCHEGGRIVLTDRDGGR